MSCYEPSELQALMKSPEAPRDALEAHLDGCERCRKLLSELMRGGTEVPEAVDDGIVLRPGAQVGRYVVLEAIGAGTSSLVYLAYDPQLDRQVSLKIVRADTQRVLGGKRAVERAAAEAQAMARLSHPHVVTVHDVGTFRGQLFIAMEFVANGSVEGWLRRGPRTWQNIVDCFRASARGLEAAHRAEIIHGDVKPANILVDVNGLGRVADFGLSSAVLSGWLSGSATPIGTPLYLAPEQIAGQRADERSDQYSFCISLFEALSGKAPVRSATGLVSRIAPPKGVPAWVWRCVFRGLEQDPARRYPNMGALADDLDVDRRTSLVRRRIFIAATLGLVLSASAFVYERRHTDRCRGDDGRLAGVWDEAKRQQLENAFRNDHRSHAPIVVAQTKRLLDQNAEEWLATRKAVCEATWVRGEQSEALLDARMACLEHARLSLSSIVDVLTNTSEAAVLDRAVKAAGAVDSARRCLSAESNGAPVSPEHAAEQATLQVALARLGALEATGKYALGLKEAEPLLAHAQSLGLAAQADVEVTMGRLHHRLGDGAAAEKVLYQAVAHAVAARAERTALLAWVLLVGAQGVDQGRAAQAQQAAAIAEALLSRTEGELDVSADFKTGLGSTMRTLGRLREAENLYREALALRRRAHGPQHPLVGTALVNLALIQSENGSVTPALTTIEEAQRIFEQFQGVDHPEMAYLVNIRGILEWQRNNDLVALRLFQQSLALRERTLGPRNRLVATNLSNICGTMLELGLTTQALPICERAFQISSEGSDANRLPIFANASNNVGHAYLALGRSDEAEMALERALSARERAFGPLLPILADDLIGLGRVALARKRPERALPLFERALQLRMSSPADAAEQDDAEFWVACALWQLGASNRAEAMLSRAISDSLLSGDRGVRVRRRINDWLASRATKPTP